MVRDTTYFFAASIVRAKGSIQSGPASVCAGGLMCRDQARLRKCRPTRTSPARCQPPITDRLPGNAMSMLANLLVYPVGDTRHPAKGGHRIAQADALLFGRVTYAAQMQEAPSLRR